MTTSHTESSGPPIACTLGADDLDDRVQAWAALSRRALLKRERAPRGAVLTYRWNPQVEEDLKSLAGLESQCCAFLAFDLKRSDEHLVLTISGPVGAEPIVELFLKAPLSNPLEHASE